MEELVIPPHGKSNAMLRRRRHRDLSLEPLTDIVILVPELDSLDESIRGYARGGNGRGRGGMETKLEAVRIANEDGRPAIIANGRTPGVLDAILAGKPIGTLFFPRKRA